MNICGQPDAQFRHTAGFPGEQPRAKKDGLEHLRRARSTRAPSLTNEEATRIEAGVPTVALSSPRTASSDRAPSSSDKFPIFLKICYFFFPVFFQIRSWGSSL